MPTENTEPVETRQPPDEWGQLAHSAAESWDLAHPGVRALYENHVVPQLHRKGLGHLAVDPGSIPEQAPQESPTGAHEPAINVTTALHLLGIHELEPGAYEGYSDEDFKAVERTRDLWAAGTLQAAYDRHREAIDPRVFAVEIAAKIKSVPESGISTMPETISSKTALALFSYADVLGGDAKGETDNPNAQKYADELVDIYARVGGNKLAELTKRMMDTTALHLQAVNIQPSMYAESPTWVLWDLAKQSYLAKHPDETGPEYHRRNFEIKKERLDATNRVIGAKGGTRQVSNLVDATQDTELARIKRYDIIDRHIGWEVAREFHETGQLGDIHPDNAALTKHEYEEILDAVLNGAKNEGYADAGKTVHALRSYALSHIGQLIRNKVISMNMVYGDRHARVKTGEILQSTAKVNQWPA